MSQISQDVSLKVFNLILLFTMYVSRNIGISDYCGEISESIDYLDDSIGNASPILRNNLLGFKSLSKIIPTFSSENQFIEALEETHGSVARYKCFKCFGTNNQLTNSASLKSCQQCSGTSYIHESHALVSIFERILSLKLTGEAEQKDNSRFEKKLRETSQDSQNFSEEHSYSYAEEQGMKQCQNCLNEYEADNVLYCIQCPQYYLCHGCHQKRKFSHPNTHILTDTCNRFSIHVCPNPSTMKKISQEFESEETSNCIEEEQEVNCHSCNQIIEDCYQACLTCEKEGFQYIICGNCSTNNNFIHNQNHQLGLKNMAQASKLLKLKSASAAQQKIKCPQSKRNANVKVKNQLSLVEFEDLDFLQGVDEKQELTSTRQNLFCNFSAEVIESPTHRLSNSHAEMKRLSNPENNEQVSQSKMMDESSVHIDMECSIELPQEQNQYQYRQQCSSKFLKLFPIENRQKHRQIITPAFNLKKYGHNLLQSSINFDMQCSIEMPLTPDAFSDMKCVSFDQKSEEYAFNDYECDICRISPIKNKRYHCQKCQNYDICEMCYTTRLKHHQHRDFELIDGLDLLRRQRESILRTDLRMTRLSIRSAESAKALK